MHRHEGEWVQPGDQVLRVIRMDRLWIDGYLSAAAYLRDEIDGRPVSVTIELAHNRRVTLSGKVVFVSPRPVGGKFSFRCEVRNKAPGRTLAAEPGA